MRLQNNPHRTSAFSSIKVRFSSFISKHPLILVLTPLLSAIVIFLTTHTGESSTITSENTTFTNTTSRLISFGAPFHSEDFKLFSLEGLLEGTARDNKSLDFSFVELDSGRTLKRCIELGVEKKWALGKTLDEELVTRCSGRDLEFLFSSLYQDCPFKWISPQHQATYYRECLEKYRYDIVLLKKRAFQIKGRDRKISGESFEDSRRKINEIKETYEEISTLLILYMKSIEDSFSNILEKVGKAAQGMVPWGEFGARCRYMFSKGVNESIPLSIALGSPEKLFEIAHGLAQLPRSTDLKKTARKTAFEVSNLFDAYIDILGISKTALLQTKPSSQRQVYSIHVEVDDGNWDFFSGVFITLQDHQRTCKTTTYSFPNGLTIFDNYENLRNCQFMEFNINTLTLRIHSQQNSLLRDAVTISTIKIRTDGNFLHSLTTNFQDPVTVSGTSASEHFKLIEMKT